jgi:hypothetical protein
VWAGLIAFAFGLGAVLRSAGALAGVTEYLVGLPAMGDHPLGWLRGFTTHLSAYPTHVKGHPPLPMLILWILRWTGLGGAGWAATLVIAAGASSTAAIAVTVRAVADEPTARRAVPFVILAPTAIWVATSMDALFLGVSAWTVALLSQASVREREGSPRPPWGATPLLWSRAVDAGGKGFHRLWITLSARTGLTAACALAAGILAGSLPYLSYGLLTIFALPLAVLLLTRPPRSRLIVFGIGCAVVPVAFTVAGFGWWDGVVQTHAAWAAGAGSRRPYAYFFVGDLAVLALTIGPAAATALPSLVTKGRPHAVAIIVGAALAGVLALDVSGVTRGEVERIWLPYAAWMTAGAAVYRVPAARRRMLLAQVATALLIQSLVKSPW